MVDFANWSTKVKPGDGDDLYRHNGAGEMLVYSAADFEDFRVERPDMPASMEGDLEPVVRLLADRKWPWRLHATYDETIGRALDVFEEIDKDIPLAGLNWFFDHAETISERNIDRIAALGGGVAVQHRMAFQGEYFVERYGAKAAEATPPIARMMAAGLKVGAGTDATRVASYNPWVLTDKLKEIFSALETTLFFEKPTLDALAAYLLDAYPEKVAEWLGLQPMPKHAAAPTVSSLNRSPRRTSNNRQSRSDRRENPTYGAASRDVAIIGVSGRYPCAEDIGAFWNNLARGKNCISEIPADRWDWRNFYSSEKGPKGGIYTRFGGFLDHIDRFDPLFFGISPREAELMDPQERLFLEEAYRSIEDAGYTLKGLASVENVGVFVGVMNSMYGSGPNYWSIANRVSYCFDFKGPSLTIDTACSSSLTAIHFACAIGSVKSNIGHCESAAGVAALTKVLLQMRHRRLAPSLHAQRLNPHFDFAATPFVVQRELGEWRRPAVEERGRIVEYPRRAGISSFGAGGANAHIVVEEYVAFTRATEAAAPVGPYFVVLSARDGERLLEQARRLLAAVSGDSFDDGDLAACGLARGEGAETLVSLGDVVWLRLLSVEEEGQAKEIETAVFEEEDGSLSWEIRDAGEPALVYSRGSAYSSAPDGGEREEIEALLRQCGDAVDREERYRSFADRGLAYGPTHRTIESLTTNGHVAVGRLAANGGEEGVEGFFLPPGLLDGALQCASALLSEGRSAPSVPFALASLEVAGPCAPAMWAVVRRAPASQSPEAVQKFDLALCDDDGAIRVRMSGFATRPLAPQTAPPKEDEVGPLLLRSAWRLAPPPGGGAFAERHVFLCGPGGDRAVFAPKVDGLVALDEATGTLALDWFVCCSSLAGALGNVGQSDYAAANAFMDRYMVWREAERADGRRSGHSLSVNWPLWAEGGMQVDPVTRKRMESRHGFTPMPTPVGVRALDEAYSAGYPTILVLNGRLPRLKSAFLQPLETARDIANDPPSSTPPTLARRSPGLSGP